MANFGSFRVFKYNIMYEYKRRQSLKLYMFFKIKFLLYIDGVLRIHILPNHYVAC